MRRPRQPGKPGPGVTDGLSKITQGCLVILTLAGGVLVGLRSAVTLVDERVRGTLELLLVEGVEPAAMIRSKLAAILAPSLALTPLIAVVALLGHLDDLKGLVAPRSVSKQSEFSPLL